MMKRRAWCYKNGDGDGSGSVLTVKYPVLRNGTIHTSSSDASPSPCPFLLPHSLFHRSIHASSSSSLFFVADIPRSSHAQPVNAPITISTHARAFHGLNASASSRFTCSITRRNCSSDISGSSTSGYKLAN